jgi:hypothetical protein
VKTALVMQALRLPRLEAERILGACAGDLAKALEQRRGASATGAS